MRCPHNLKLRWKSEWKIQFLFYSLQGKLTACWAGISASLSAPPDSFTLAPQDRGRGLCRNSTLGCIFSCPLWPAPLPPLSTFLTWPLSVCCTHFLQKQGWFPAFLKMFCSLFWWINRRTVRVPWWFGYFVLAWGVFVYVLGEKQKKEILNLN